MRRASLLWLQNQKWLPARLSYSVAHADVVKSKQISGNLWVTVMNSEYGYFPFRTTQFYQIDTLDLLLKDKAGNKNSDEIKGICSNPKKEMSHKPSCYSEEVFGSKSVAKRICEVAMTFSCQ